MDESLRVHFKAFKILSRNYEAEMQVLEDVEHSRLGHPFQRVVGVLEQIVVEVQMEDLRQGLPRWKLLQHHLILKLLALQSDGDVLLVVRDNVKELN